MTTNQQQQVVMIPINEGQTTLQQTSDGLNTNKPAVVVVQHLATGHIHSDQGNRFSRWAYLIFGIGMGAYNFLYAIFWTITTTASVRYSCANSLDCTENPLHGYGALFFVCGVVPSIIGFIWMINDSTVFCANPGNGHIQKICCCNCINGWAMAVPMVIAAVLRFILWCVFFGILADFLNEIEGEAFIDNVFWLILSIGSVDVGPFILCAIDWWWYYGKRDYNGLFGHKLNPLRCVTGASIVIMICSWSLIAVFEEYADDVAEFIWPWILHGILSTAILIFAAFLQFSGSIQGAFVNNALLNFVCWGLASAQGILVLIVCGFILEWTFRVTDDALVALIFIIYCVYYAGLTVPISWCLFSMQANNSGGGNPAV